MNSTKSSIEKKAPEFHITITPTEMKELRRVFDQLCLFADKAPKLQRLNVLSSQLVALQRQDSSHDVILSSTFGDPTSSLSDILSKAETIKEEKSKLENELNDIRARPDQLIRPEDTASAIKALGKRMTKKEINDMMWEVDEKLDGVIDWDEFQLMFERNINDTSGLEPASFYHMVQFMIYDSDCNGMVSIDEIMNMLYARIGRSKMEHAITKLFGSEDGTPIQEVGHQGGEIDFQHYWTVVEREQLKVFHDNEMTKVTVDKKKKKVPIGKIKK
jgi:Ca2+-binding EF-hand superfamily protein